MPKKSPFAIDEKWLSNPTIVRGISNFIASVSHLPAKEQHKQWTDFKRSINDKPPPSRVTFEEVPAQLTHATVKVMLYFQSELGVTDAIEIDGVKFGLMRQPNRVTFKLSKKLKSLIGKHIETDGPDFEFLMEMLNDVDADNIITTINSLRSKLAFIVLSDFSNAPQSTGISLVNQRVG